MAHIYRLIIRVLGIAAVIVWILVFATVARADTTCTIWTIFGNCGGAPLCSQIYQNKAAAISAIMTLPICTSSTSSYTCAEDADGVQLFQKGNGEPAGFLAGATSSTGTGSQCVSCTSGASISSGIYDMGDSPAVKRITCSGGCEAQYEGADIGFRALVGGKYHYFASGSYSKTGQTCTGSDATPSAGTSAPNPSCGSGQVLGDVNGKPTCLAGGTDPINPNTGAPNTNPSNPTTTTTPAADQGDGTTKSTSTTTNPNGTTTTTTTTCVTATGVCTSETDTTGEDPLGSFCEENPKSKICSEEKGSANGSCSGAAANVSCDGDAILCAIYRQQMAQDCLFNAPSDESAIYDGAKAGTDIGDTQNPALLANRDNITIQSTLDQSEHFVPGCISDRDFFFSTWHMTIPFSLLCPYLQYAGQVLVIVSLIMSVRIVGVW